MWYAHKNLYTGDVEENRTEIAENVFLTVLCIF